MMNKVVALAGATAASAMSLDADVGLFNTWKAKHNKTYETEEHELTRFRVFKENAAYINMHNMKGESFRLALNQFADMTNMEYKNFLLGSGHAPKRTGSKYIAPKNTGDVPDSVDWRDQGYVTPVKDQGQCGSCWAFSTVASLEGQYFAANGNTCTDGDLKLCSFAEQQLVDCSSQFGNHGCSGGLMDYGFEYIKSLPQGIDTEASYAYTATDGSCKATEGKTVTPAATVSGYTDVTQGSEDDLTSAIATVGPISVAIDASHMSFQFYSSGVYYEAACSSSMLDHGVTAIGYGTDDSSDDYYIVKNSWGEGWGNQGYIWMSRNRKNNCGIASSASYPLM